MVACTDLELLGKFPKPVAQPKGILEASPSLRGSVGWRILGIRGGKEVAGLLPEGALGHAGAGAGILSLLCGWVLPESLRASLPKGNENTNVFG